MSLVRSLAVELAPQGIRVNAVSAGPIDTPLLGKLGLPDDVLADFQARLSERIPLGHIGNADHVARAVAFLASPGAAYITGANIPVDGGLGASL